MRNKHLVYVVLIAIFSLFLMWLPFLLHTKSLLGVNFGSTGMDRIVSNFDGINFLVVAKTAYDPQVIANNFQDILNGRRPLYFSAHYPGYPTVIALFLQFLNGPNSVLATIVLSNILLAVALYLFFEQKLKNPELAATLSIVAMFFPARMLSNRIVGSNEGLFIFFVLISLYLFNKGKYFYSAILGSLAVLTRSPGILLFGAYFLYFLKPDRPMKERVYDFLPYLLIPTSLLALWGYYGMQFGSFWAYFQVGGNINLYWPFSVFASQMDWVSGIWNEDLIYLIAIILIGGYTFVRKYRWTPESIYVALYGLFVISVAHRDLARYSLPLIPLLLLPYFKLFESKYLKIIGIILLIPIALYSWQFVIQNYQNVIDWTNYL